MADRPRPAIVADLTEARARVFELEAELAMADLDRPRLELVRDSAADPYAVLRSINARLSAAAACDLGRFIERLRTEPLPSGAPVPLFDDDDLAPAG